VVEMPANGGLLRIGYRSPCSEFDHFRGRKLRKSPATYRNIRVFGRPRPETGFEPVQFNIRRSDNFASKPCQCRSG
jgi:hypothetical protein